MQNVANGESESQRRPRGVTNDTRRTAPAAAGATREGEPYRVRTSMQRGLHPSVLPARARLDPSLFISPSVAYRSYGNAISRIRELASSKRANNARGCRRWLDNVWLAYNRRTVHHPLSPGSSPVPSPFRARTPCAPALERRPRR